MGRPLRVLIVEDSESDAKLLLREIRKGGFDPLFERVDDASGMRAALERQEWDLVISDWAMPGFGALEALAVMKQRGLDLPFIIVSGAIGEEIAVEGMKAGAHDFLLKDKLNRLVPAIERELREASIRRDRDKMQKYLQMSDRMVSMGTPAAGVAHEVNNPLAYVISNLEFAIDELEGIQQGSRKPNDIAEVITALREAHGGADRVRSIVRGLKMFSRGDDERRGPVDVERVLESSINMVWNEIRHRARLVRDYRPVPAVHANDNQLGQVFVNLLINAAQAIPEGHSDRNEIRVVTRSDGNRVRVEIHDTGVGIAPEHLHRIFEPFFTTKPVGVGTGLGLSICHGIVHGLGGEITVESQQGMGTVFHVWLPVENQPERTTPLPCALRVSGRRARLLVIDDELMLVRLFQRALSSEHDVVALTDPQEALERVRAGEPFDIIFCDLMMPTMTGMEVHAHLQELSPELAARMVFLSGGVFTPTAKEFLDRVPNHRIEKPFELGQLRAFIREYMQQASAVDHTRYNGVER